MNTNELKKAVISGDELSFSHNGRSYLLYGWEQCDGFVLNIADTAGEILWQTAPASREQCAEAFRAYMKNQ